MREDDEEKDPPRRSRRRRDEDEESDFDSDDDRPRRRRRRDEESDSDREDEDDHPRRRRRRDEESDSDWDDEDDRPRRRRRPRESDWDEPAMEYVIPLNTSALAILAGYVGLISVLCFPAPLALILGILALRQLKQNPKLRGHGRAIFAIMMGGLFTALPLGFLVYAAIMNK